MARLSQWSPYNRYVQSGLVDGEFINAAFTMLAAGPPRLGNIGALAFAGEALTLGGADTVVFPIGIVQNFNLSHNRQFNRVFELGSERSFFISGRTMGQLGLSRILYHGPSLLRVMYAYYQDNVGTTVVHSLMGEDSVTGLMTPNAHDVKIPPGYENLFINLASDLFAQPVGIMAYFKDSNEHTYGSAYLESCYIPNHTISTDAGGTIVQENCAVQFERAMPVAVSAVAAIGLDAADQEILGL